MNYTNYIKNSVENLQNSKKSSTLNLISQVLCNNSNVNIAAIISQPHNNNITLKFDDLAIKINQYN